jgi:hypothetical protein
MYSFLVLGLIPGTNIAISFQVWLVVMVVALVGFMIVRKRIEQFIISIVDEMFGTPQRQPLHASQLHLRAL